MTDNWTAPNLRKHQRKRKKVIMTPGLKHNIEAMKTTKQAPHFVQVLVTFEEALAEIERLLALVALAQKLERELTKEAADYKAEGERHIKTIAELRYEIERLKHGHP